MSECPNKHCQEQRETDHDDVTALKTRWKVIGSVLGGGLVLLGIIMTVLNDYRADAQETATAAMAEIKKESTEKDKEHDEKIRDLELTVKGIEGKIDNALEEADRKQQETLDAIKDLKED